MDYGHLPPLARPPLAPIHAPLTKQTLCSIANTRPAAVQSAMYLQLLFVLKQQRRAEQVLRDIVAGEYGIYGLSMWRVQTGVDRARLGNEKRQEQRRLRECDARLSEIALELVIMSRWEREDKPAKLE